MVVTEDVGNARGDKGEDVRLHQGRVAQNVGNEVSIFSNMFELKKQT